MDVHRGHVFSRAQGGLVEGMSIREASRVFSLHRDTVRKILSHPVPPGYRRKRPPHRPKLEPYTGVIDGILEDDLSAPKKQRHTAKRIFERLREEHRFDGGYTVIEVNRPDRSVRYRKGKSDPTDAEMAARSVLADVADATCMLYLTCKRDSL